MMDTKLGIYEFVIFHAIYYSTMYVCIYYCMQTPEFFHEKQKESTILARELLNGCFFYDTEVHTVLVRVSITRIYSTILYDEGQLALKTISSTV